MLTDADREWIEERAAIREYDGRQTRSDAERDALLDWKRMIARKTTPLSRPAD